MLDFQNIIMFRRKCFSEKGVDHIGTNAWTTKFSAKLVLLSKIQSKILYGWLIDMR